MDFQSASADSEDRQRSMIDRSLDKYGISAERHADCLSKGLSLMLQTPLGGELGDATLGNVSRAQRIDEMRFDLPLLGGTEHRGMGDALGPARAMVAALRGRDDDVLPAHWLASLDRLDGVALAGFLTGFIDLVFQAPIPTGEERWFLADYKSNRIDPNRTGRCTPEGFGVAQMRDEMARHDYFLQYHLYLVALHRYLRWRIADYDYDRHVGGVYYLFLRGMIGPDAVRDGDQVRGCWFDRPSRDVVEALDRALATGECA
jgi:exodeoxyribonuclease V beta subunit